MFDQHPLAAQAEADLRADWESYIAWQETTLDLGPFGPDRDRFDRDVLYGSSTRSEADAARVAAAEAAAADALLPF